MKNLSNLGFAVLLPVILGCACPKLNDLTKQLNVTNSNSPTVPSNSAVVPSQPDKNGDKPTLTMDQYNRIKDKMARPDVEKILGGKGIEVSSSSGGGMKFTVNKWEGSNYKTIIISFQNEQVMSKSQVGLDK